MKKLVLASIVVLAAAAAAEAQSGVRCESTNGKYKECRISGSGSVMLMQQLSDTACVQGKNWGMRNGFVWVSGGCRGDFAMSDALGANRLNGLGAMVVCESQNNGRNNCNADIRHGVTIARVLSDNACVRGRSWGTNEKGIWVDRGCRAEFLLGDNASHVQPGASLVRCESQNNGRSECRADTSFGVRLAKRVSKNACVHGRDWGFDDDEIWVNNGCRADFVVGGIDAMNTRPMTSSGRPTLLCESRDGKRTFCAANTSFGVTLTKQVSETNCVRGTNWGYDQNGIWVDRGCRAEFLLDVVR